jgi:hypothetical protein
MIMPRATVLWRGCDVYLVVGHALLESMQRNIVTLIVGISLNLVLILLQMTFGLHIQVGTFNVVWLGIAIVIGFVVGLCAQRVAWWLAAVCLLPMLIYGSLFEQVDTNITFFIVDLLVGMVVAFAVSRFRQNPEIA